MSQAEKGALLSGGTAWVTRVSHGRLRLYRGAVKLSMPIPLMITLFLEIAIDIMGFEAVITHTLFDHLPPPH